MKRCLYNMERTLSSSLGILCSCPLASVKRLGNVLCVWRQIEDSLSFSVSIKNCPAVVELEGVRTGLRLKAFPLLLSVLGDFHGLHL